MRFLTVMLTVFAWFCFAIGIVTLLGALPPLHFALTWYVWFAFSGLLFLAIIAANVGGRRGGGGEY